MCTELKISIAVVGSYSAVVLLEDNQIIKHSVEKCFDTTDGYTNLMNTFSRGVLLAAKHLESANCVYVNFEIPDKTFVTWLNQQYAQAPYVESFHNCVLTLQSLPYRYVSTYANPTVAISYAKATYLEKPVLSSGLAFFDTIEET